MEDLLSGKSLSPDRKSVFAHNVENELGIFSLLLDHVKAFDQGFIPCQRLFEVVVPLFLKLARKVNQDQNPENSADAHVQRITGSLFSGLGAGLTDILKPFLCKDSHGMGLPHWIGLKKRAEFVKALMKSKFPEVSASSASKCSAVLTAGVLE